MLNEYEARGIIADAATGKSILVIARDQRECETAASCITERLGMVVQTHIVHICRVNGRGQIDIGAGSIYFRSASGRGARGLAADIVVIDEALVHDEQIHMALMSIIAPTDGRVIRT